MHIFGKLASVRSVYRDSGQHTPRTDRNRSSESLHWDLLLHMRMSGVGVMLGDGLQLRRLPGRDPAHQVRNPVDTVTLEQAGRDRRPVAACTMHDH